MGRGGNQRLHYFTTQISPKQKKSFLFINLSFLKDWGGDYTLPKNDLTCFLIHHELFTATKSDAIGFKLWWMPLAEGTLRTPEKRELLLVIIFNAFSSHQENSSLTVWCVLNWATGRGVGRNLRKGGQSLWRAKRAAKFFEATPIWGAWSRHFPPF